MSPKSEKVLTAKIAEKAVAQEECIFDEYEEIELPAAEVLEKYEGTVSLDRLTQVKDSLAKHLANHTGALFLNGVAELPTAVAEIFSKHQGGLYLNGLKNLDVSSARYLTQTSGILSLDGLQRISDELGHVLAGHNGALRLNGLTDLSTKAAKALFQSDEELYLNGLTTLSPEIASILAGFSEEGSHSKGYRSFGGLESVSDQLFEIFSKYEEGLGWQSYARIPNGPRGIYVGCLYEIQKVALAKGTDDQEFVVGISFDYCDRSYAGFRIMQRGEIRRLIAALETESKVGTPNMPGEWYEEFNISLLKDSFQIHSPWPCDIKAMRELFGDSVGETSLFDSVLEHAPASDN